MQYTLWADVTRSPKQWTPTKDRICLCACSKRGSYSMWFYFRVEHLEQDVLESFPAVVFGMINPKVVIVTTPNCEFNVLFPNFTGFRHPDHKFEWTRAQFQEW